jgi:hypothetical protein
MSRLIEAGAPLAANPAPTKPLLKRGRRPRAMVAEQPYPTPRRRHDTGRWVWSFRDPVTGDYRKNQRLVYPTTGEAPRTLGEAHVTAKANWDAFAADLERAAHGLTLRKRFHPKELLENFVEHQRSQSTRTASEEDNIRLAIQDLGRYTRFARCTNLSMVFGEFAIGILTDLRKATREIASERKFREPENWVRTRLLVLQRMIRWAAEHLGMPVTGGGLSPVLRKLPAPRRPWDFFYVVHEAAALERVLKYGCVSTHDPYLTMFVWIAMYTGGRRSEVFCARVRDVFFEGTARHENGAIRLWNSTLERHKRSKGIPDTREVPLFPKLRKALEHFIRDLALGPDDFLCLSPARVRELVKRGVSLDDPRALHLAVAQMSQTSLYRCLRKLCDAAGVPYRNGGHVWRHSYVATRGRMVYEGGNPVTLSDLQGEIGHIDDSDTTRSVYDKAMQVPLVKQFSVLDWREMAHSSWKTQRAKKREKEARAVRLSRVD